MSSNEKPKRNVDSIARASAMANRNTAANGRGTDSRNSSSQRGSLFGRLFGGGKKQNLDTRRHVRATQPEQVFSYYASRSRSDAVDGSDTRGRRSYTEADGARRGADTRSRLANVPAWGSVLVILVALIYASTLSASPRISVVADEGSLHRSSDVYQGYAQELLRQSIFNRSKLTLNSTRVELAMAAKYPEIVSVSVSAPLIARRPVVQLVTVQPVLIVQSEGSKDSYYVRPDGVAVVRVGDITDRPADNLPIVVDQGGLEVAQGAHVITKGTVGFIVEVLRQLTAKGLTPTDLVLPAQPNELQLRIKDKPYYVRFNTFNDARQQAGSYLAVSEKLVNDGVTPREYIDLRVSERAYYR